MRLKKFYRPDELSKSLRKSVEHYLLVFEDDSEYEVKDSQVFDRVKCPTVPHEGKTATVYLRDIVKSRDNLEVLSLSDTDHHAYIGILAKSILPYRLNEGQMNALGIRHGHLPWLPGYIAYQGVSVCPCSHYYCRNQMLDRMIRYPQFLTSQWCQSNEFVGGDKKWILAVDESVAWQLIRQALINDTAHKIPGPMDMLFASNLSMLLKTKEINPGVLRQDKAVVIFWDDPQGYAASEAISLIQMYLQGCTGYVFVLDSQFESSRLNSQSMQTVIRSCGVRVVDSRSLEYDREVPCV